MWAEKIRLSQIHSKCSQMMGNGFGGVLWVSEHLFHDAKPSRSHFWKNFKKSKFDLKSEFLPWKLAFTWKNVIFLRKASLIKKFPWVFGANHCIQRHFGSIPKASRAIFSILFLLFEKMNFFHSQASTCSKIGFKVHILHVKNHFVGWKNSNFSNSFRMFLNDVEWVWECALGLGASFSRCYTI